MSRDLDAAEALARVPAFEDARVEAKLPGLTNRSYLVRNAGDRFVLRLDAAHTRAVGLDRHAELAMLERAAGEDLGPEIVYADPEQGVLVTRFLRGRTPDPNDFDDPRLLERIAGLLRRVHALEPLGKRMQALTLARAYAERLPDELRRRAATGASLTVIEAASTPPVVTACHNDVIAANLIDGDGLRLIDWEYACDNDPLFDLASLVGYHGLSEATADDLLSAYTGGIEPETRERLAGQRAIYDALSWLWFALRQSVCPDGVIADRLRVLEARLAGRDRCRPSS